MNRAEQIAAGQAIPSYQFPCGRRTVVIGKWGHQLAHPSDCPDCAKLAALLKGQNNEQQ